MALEDITYSSPHLFVGGKIANIFEELGGERESDDGLSFLVAPCRGRVTFGVRWCIVFSEVFSFLNGEKVEYFLLPCMVVGIGKFFSLEAINV